MLKYPSNPAELNEVKSIENTFKTLLAKPGTNSEMELLIVRNLSEKYKKLMDWDKQILSGPIYPTT